MKFISLLGLFILFFLPVGELRGGKIYPGFCQGGRSEAPNGSSADSLLEEFSEKLTAQDGGDFQAAVDHTREIWDYAPAPPSSSNCAQWGKLSPLLVVGMDALVYFLPGTSVEESRRVLHHLGLELLKREPFPLQVVYRVYITQSFRSKELEFEPMIAFILPVPPPVHPCNINEQDTINVDILHAPPYNLDGSGEVVGVWDQVGVLTTHQEFSGRVIQQDSPGSVSHHATHVTGTIAASGVDGNAQGMAPAATVWCHDWDEDTREWWQERLSIVASNHSYTNYVGWYGTSWWGPPDQEEDPNFGKYSGEAYEWDAMIYRSNVVVVRAAGNERLDTGTTGAHSHAGSGTYYDYHKGDNWWAGGYDTIAWAAGAKNVITVGAIDQVTADPYDDSDVTMTDFSSWGPMDDGRIKPDIVSDGYLVYSSIASSDTAYGNMRGTSQAAPGIASSMALLSQEYASIFGSLASAVLLKGLTLHSAHDVGRPGPDYQFGWGVADIQAAVDLLELDGGTHTYATTDSLAEGTVSYLITITSPETIKVTISWFDPEGDPNMGALNDPTPALINDLDLLLISPDGTPHYPWTLDRNSPWTDAVRTSPNHVDNTEQVWVPASESMAGTWTIRIHATSLPLSPQVFALLSSHPLQGCSTSSLWVDWQSGYPMATEYCGHIALCWQPAIAQCGGQLTYDLHRSTTEGFTPSAQTLIAGGITNLSYDDGPLSPGTPVYYRIIPREDGQEGEMSPEVMIVPQAGIDTDSPSSVENVTAAESVNCREVELTWASSMDRCSEPVIYRIYRDTNPGVMPSPATYVGMTTETSFRDSALGVTTSLFYTLVAEDQSGNGSDPSPVVGVDNPIGDAVDLFEDVEGDTSSWVLGGDWSVTDCSSHSGIYTFSLHLVPCLTYPGGSNSILERSAIVVNPANPPSLLRFWHRFQSERNYDTGTVSIDHDDDGTFTTLATFSGDIASEWREVRMDLSSLSGWAATASLKIVFMSDSNTQSGSGWQMDDIALIHPSSACSGCELPSEVNNLRCQKSGNDVVCNWDPEALSAHYKILDYLGPPFSAYVALGTSDITSFSQVSALLVKENFFYRIRGVNTCGQIGP